MVSVDTLVSVGGGASLFQCRCSDPAKFLASLTDMNRCCYSSSPERIRADEVPKFGRLWRWEALRTEPDPNGESHRSKGSNRPEAVIQLLRKSNSSQAEKSKSIYD